MVAVVIGITLLLAGVTFFWFDPLLATILHHYASPGWRAITALGNAAFALAISLGLYLLWRTRNPQQAKKALYVLASVALSGLIVDILKPLIGRARPKLLFNEGFYGFEPLTFKASYWSMPSGHSATAFALGVSLALLFPRYRLLWLALAGLVALSRVILGKHYPSDVLIGSLIGALTAWWLYRRIFDG
ncbi:MAG: phosphatase PAP2 family protein [Nitratiruptor sp.]|nr:phosphatase PAP2 family protein [Nitratiruptor sp.]NPA83143.1 phosphatase PAP2 family protein [Campylobacterota bacterium]